MKKLLSILLVAGVALAIMIPAQAEEIKSEVSCTEWMPLNPTNPNTVYIMICESGGRLMHFQKPCYYCPDPPDMPE